MKYDVRVSRQLKVMKISRAVSLVRLELSPNLPTVFRHPTSGFLNRNDAICSLENIS